MLNEEASEEARDWVAADNTHVITTFTHADTVKAIDDLYKAGAAEVHVSNVVKRGDLVHADKLVIDWPKDPAVRQKIIAVHAPLFARKKIGVPPDNGPDQEYLILHFDGNDD
jgi:hypothetical protein